MADQDWNVGPNGRPKAEPTLGPSPRVQMAPDVEMPPDPEFEPIYQPRPRRRLGLRIVLMLLLVLGGGSAAAWYYYGDLLFIDPNQEIPLVRAEGDPIKIRPESPGGMEIPDRDKLVYDRIPGAEERQSVERLLPPPETPLPRPEPEPAPEGQASAPPTPDTTTPPDTGTSSTASTPTPLTPAPSAPSIAGTTPPSAPTETTPTPTAPEVAAAPEPGASTGQTPEASPTPTAPTPPPPAASDTASAPPAPPAELSREAQRKAAEVATRTPPPAPTTSSGQAYQVQLAAVRARDRAEQEWARLRNGHKDLLGTLQLSVVRADLGAGKGVFYRLRVGPLKTEAVARDLCGKLAERKVPCLVVRPN